MSTVLSRFELVAKAKRDHSLVPKITVRKDSISFNKPLMEKHKNSYYGLYFDPVSKDIAIHFSPVAQSGYRKTRHQSKNPQAYDIFLNAGHGELLVSPKEFYRLNYADEFTIIISSPLKNAEKNI